MNPDGMIQHCPHIQEAMITHGAGYGQGLWMLDVLTSTFLDDGRRWAHYMSHSHNKYDKDDCDAMYDRKMAEHRPKGSAGPAVRHSRTKAASCARPA